MAIDFWPFWRATIISFCPGFHPPSSSFVIQPHINNTLFTDLFGGLSSLFNVARLLVGREVTFCDSHCSRYLLLLAGDVERNPGPISKDAKPKLSELQCMPCISKDGASYFFRLMDRIKPRLTDLAIALDFPVYVIDILETKPNPVYYLLSEWLKGRNQEYDSRPLTWATLITALQHAGLLEEVKILEQHCLATRTSLATVLSQTSTCPTENSIVPTKAVSDSLKGADLVHHPEEGQHGPVQVFVKPGPDVPESLLPLMKSYANMLLVLRTTELPEEKFCRLKIFLSDVCNEKSIRQCSSLDDVIDLLKEHLKIYYFNIDTLNISCDYFCSCDGRHICSCEVKASLEQYRQQLSDFLSNTSIIKFKGILKTKIVDSSKVETITVKLDESRTEDTLEALRKLIFHFFGIHYKAIILFRTDEGCVRITWIVPMSLVPIIREKAEQLSPEYLASKGVLELVISLRIAPNEAFLSDHTTSTTAVAKVDHASESDTGALNSKTDIVEQHAMGVDSSDMMIAAIQKRYQSELEAVHREVEMLQQKLANSEKHEQRLECELDMAKRSAQAVISELEKKVQTLEEVQQKLSTEKKALYSALKQQSIPVTVGGVKLELVIDELKEIADDWKQFGGHLMSKYLLEKIELQEESPVKCLELVIVKWKQVYPDGTWMDIAAALEKIEKSKLASIIQQKYVRPVALESSSKSEGTSSLQLKPEAERFDLKIEQQMTVVPVTQETSDTKPGLLLKCYQKTKHLPMGGNWKFLGLLLKIEKYLLDEIEKDNLRDVASCRIEMLHSWLKSNPANPTQALDDALIEMALVHSSSTHKTDCLRIDHSTNKQIDSLKNSFAEIVSKTCRSLQNHYPDPQDATVWLNECLRGTIDEPLVIEQSVADYSDLFRQLQRKWSFSKPAILQRMVEKIEDSTLIEEMRVYKETFSIFCHSFPISDLVQGIFDTSQQPQPCLVILSEPDINFYVIEIFLADVFDIYGRYLRVHKLHVPSLQ